MTEAVDQKKNSARIPFVAKNGMTLFNCTQDTIDKAVENGSRRNAYFMIDGWEDFP